jgi:hypothetical protein
MDTTLLQKDNDLDDNAEARSSMTQTGHGQPKGKSSELNEGEWNRSSHANSSIRRRSSDFDQGAGLCQRCKNIDFQAIFNRSEIIPLSNGLPILAPENIEKSTQCSVCRLFAAVSFPGFCGEFGEGFHLRIFSTNALLREKGTKNQEPRTNGQVLACVSQVVSSFAKNLRCGNGESTPNLSLSCQLSGAIIHASLDPCTEATRSMHNLSVMSIYKNG